MQEKEQICALLPTTAVDESLFDTSDLQETTETLRVDYEKLKERLEGYDQKIATVRRNITALVEQNSDADGKKSDLSKMLQKDVILSIQGMIAELSEDVLAAQLVQARARIESISLPEVDISPIEALEIARNCRRDWANSRAALVDIWRTIEVAADDLESSLDLVFSGDIQTPSGAKHPFSLDPNAGRLRLGFRWDAPLTRLTERNTYRESLINFQRARRSYYQFEDQIWQILRAHLRQVRANQVNFELQRSAVRIAAEQISLNEDIRLLREARGLSSGPTAARDVISALNDLLNAQNGFLGIWVNYEANRRVLNLDLGTMELTPDGFWIDPIAIRGNTLGGIQLNQAVDDDGAIIIQSDDFLPGNDSRLVPADVQPPAPPQAIPNARLPSQIRSVSHEAKKKKVQKISF